jgi:hypothetical protein
MIEVSIRLSLSGTADQVPEATSLMSVALAEAERTLGDNQQMVVHEVHVMEVDA